MEQEATNSLLEEGKSAAPTDLAPIPEEKARGVGRPKGTPKTGGRTKGSRNFPKTLSKRAAAVEIRAFCQGLFARKKFHAELRRQWDALTLDPGLVRVLLAYGFGKPPEKVEISGPDGGPIKQRVTFYIPQNFRPRRELPNAMGEIIQGTGRVVETVSEPETAPSN